MFSLCRISRGQMASLTSVKFQIYMTVSNMISYTTGSGLLFYILYDYMLYTSTGLLNYICNQSLSVT